MSNAIQLYSVREMLKQDYMGTLKYLADIGYDGVEFYGGVEVNCGYSTKEIKEKLEFLGLEAVSAHVGFDVLEKNFDFITDYYKEIGVKCQTKTKVAGGNDSGAIHKAAGGIRTAAISVPTRYLHTASCVVDLEDVRAVEALAEAMYKKLCVL